MATTSAAASQSNGVHFNAPDARITGRDIGSGNISGQNISSIVNHYHGISGGSKDAFVEIISWLGPYAVDYFPAHEEARLQRAPDTGKWFFSTTTYRTWVIACWTKFRQLECVGIPGGGKTTMASTVIEDLQAGFLARRGFAIVLYAYFRHDMQSAQSIPFILASLLLQVIMKKRKVSKAVRKLFEDYSSHKNVPPAADRLMALLRSELSRYLRVYIIVDALDEYSVPDYSLSYTLVTQLQLLNARLLITSRHPVGFKPGTFLTLHISAHTDDVRILVQQHLTGHLATILSSTHGLLDEIVSAVVAKSDGMFIAARLLVDYIPNSQSLTANELRAAVKELPNGIQNTYKMAMMRVRDQEPHLAALGIETLCWVYYSKRRLTITELRHALSFHRYGKLSKDDLIWEDRISTACAGLISFVKPVEGDSDSQEAILECHFSHFTMREFLDRSWQKYFLDGERHITEICLAYLSAAVSGVPVDIIEAAREDSGRNAVWQQYCQEHGLALSSYAAEYWIHHARAFSDVVELDAGADFFGHPISPFMTNEDESLVWPTGSTAPGHHWLLCFARFGVLKLLQMRYTRFPFTILYDMAPGPLWCTGLERSATTCLLNGRQWAQSVRERYIWQGNQDKSPGAHSTQTWCKGPRMRTLNYNRIWDRLGRTALHLSAFGGHLETVKYLLDSKANVNLVDNNERSPLHFAVQAGCSGVAVVQLLLERGAIVDRPDDFLRQAPISYAIEPLRCLTSNHPSPRIIHLLLQHEVDVYRVDREGETPLSRAQRNEHPEIKKLVEDYARLHPPKATREDGYAFCQRMELG